MYKIIFKIFLLLFIFHFSESAFSQQTNISDNKSNDKAKNLQEDDPYDETIKSSIIMNLSFSGSSNLWKNFFSNLNFNKFDDDSSNLAIIITPSVTNSYTNSMHFGVTFNEIIYFDNKLDKKYFFFSPGFELGKNFIFTDGFGLCLYYGVNEWINLTNFDKKKFPHNIGFSFGLKIPFRIKGIYIIPFIEYKVNSRDSFEEMFLFGMNFGWNYF